MQPKLKKKRKDKYKNRNKPTKKLVLGMPWKTPIGAVCGRCGTVKRYTLTEGGTRVLKCPMRDKDDYGRYCVIGERIYK